MNIKAITVTIGRLGTTFTGFREDGSRISLSHDEAMLYAEKGVIVVTEFCYGQEILAINGVLTEVK